MLSTKASIVQFSDQIKASTHPTLTQGTIPIAIMWKLPWKNTFFLLLLGFGEGSDKCFTNKTLCLCFTNKMLICVSETKVPFVFTNKSFIIYFTSKTFICIYKQNLYFHLTNKSFICCTNKSLVCIYKQNIWCVFYKKNPLFVFYKQKVI